MELSNNKPKKILAIELTNHCNLMCPHCPNGRLEVPKGYMDEDTFLECVKYCTGYTELNWRGEPLLHPKIVDFVRIAKEVNKSLSLGIHTNALLMTKTLFEKLVANGIDWIHVSLHTPESCSKYQELLEWNEQGKIPISIYAEVDTTQEELIARSCCLTDNSFQKNHIANWGGYLTEYRQVNKDPEAHARKCQFYHENHFIVAWDGMVNACCWDYEQLHCLGHVKNFEKIQHMPPYKLCQFCIWIDLNEISLPRIIDEGIEGFNIIFYKNSYFAFLQSIGPLDLASLKDQDFIKYKRERSCFSGNTIDEVKTQIKQTINSK